MHRMAQLQSPLVRRFHGTAAKLDMDRPSLFGHSSFLRHSDFDILHLPTAWAFVGLGLTLRLTRYLLHFPLWGDETYVAVQLLDRGYADLLRPLDLLQVCPLFFLWLELSAVKLLGFSEWSLRLFPTLCSLASVLVFRNLAARVLQGWSSTLAVAVFAISYYPIRHGAEAKPYAGDLLCALVLLSLAAACLSEPQRAGRLWVLAAITPLCLGLSFTAAFVAGGVALTLLPGVWRQKRPSVCAAYIGYVLTMLGAFATLYFAYIRPLYEVSSKNMVGHHWKTAFPPMDDAVIFARWLVQEHTGRMLAYPLGGQHGGSTVTLFLCLLGLVMLWRQGDRKWIALCLTPFAIGFLAAVIRKYPYGESARTMQYIAPAVCLLAGLGLAALLSWRVDLFKQRPLLAALSVLAAIGCGLGIKDLVQPYKSKDDLVNREFARWFYRDNAIDAELVCAERDLGLDFRALGRVCSSPEFVCNQRIYSQCGRGQPPDWQRISPEHPLRVVLHTVEGDARDRKALQAWLEDLQTQRGLALINVQSYRLNVGAGDTWGRLIEMFELIPRESSQAANPVWPIHLR
jgi:hypothetical protein